MAEGRRRPLSKKKQLYLILTVSFLVVCLLIEGLGRIPWIPFDGWSDVYSFFGMEMETVVPEGELQVHFVDVGNADCILVRQESFNMLIDAGERSSSSVVLDYLNRHHVDKLDLIIATHPDADHIGGMSEVINAVEVGRFVMAYMPEGEEPTTAIYINMLEALDKHNIEIVEAKAGDVYEVGTARLQILAPLKESDDTNAMSIVTRLVFGDRAFLFTGDADEQVERLIMTKGYNVKADVLKVGHHGSKSSSSRAFLDAVSPSYAVITCGEGNRYGHPNEQTLTRLIERKIPYIRSDVSGDIVFYTDGTELTVKKELGD